ncbi:hypothetical protein BDF14DRAFT_1884157 [Spinellus fusiger]|nr:hypothetical protein BDF14DRAFT_1884157 [Spinellus fusiger]
MYYYNVLWVLCLLCFVLIVIYIVKKRRLAAQRLAGTHHPPVGIYTYNPTGQEPYHTNVAMDHQHHHQGNPYYGQPYPDTNAYPPHPQGASTAVTPPPPSYQDYSKDTRLQQGPHSSS